MNDFRFALRGLTKHPGFMAAAVLTLALGIGGTTAIFTLLDHIVLRPLPYPQAERLVTLRHAAPGLGLTDAGQSDGTYFHYRAGNHALEEMGAYQGYAVNLSGVDQPERVPVAAVTASVFQVLGVQPERGRLFTEAETRQEADVVVISHRLWARHYGADPDVVGRGIELDRRRYTVVGVLPAGFDFPGRETEVWYPFAAIYQHRLALGFYLEAVGRLRPGISPRDAEADLQSLIPRLPETIPGLSPQRLREMQLRAVVVPLKRAVIGDLGSALWVLLGGVGFLLVIACANVANLFLVRAEHRQRELAVRCALGAARRDIGRALLVEAALLAAGGAFLGLMLANAGVTVLKAIGPDLPRLSAVTVDGRAFGLTALLGALSTLVLLLAPYLKYRRADVGAQLATTRPGVEAPERQALRRGLVPMQIALALVLLVGSTLMVRSYWRLSRVDPGFQPDGVLMVEVALPPSAYRTYQAAASFYSRLLEGVRALPGVTEAGANSSIPLTPFPSYYRGRWPVRTDRGDTLLVEVLENLATPDYFATMRIPLVEGRTFAPGDLQSDQRPVMVNRAMAQLYFPGHSALGRLGRTLTIVGVVEDVRQESLKAPAVPTIYYPVLPGSDVRWTPYSPWLMGVAIRTALPPASLGASVRRLVQDLDPNLPIANVRTMDDIVAASTTRTRFTMLLLLVAATAALFLGAIGVYGVMAYTVSRRTHEMGVRVALGANAAELVTLVLRQAAVVAFTGLLFGTLGALALTRLLRGFLFDVTPTDPWSFAATALLLLAATLLASWLPARRAARIDPMEALRYE